MELRKIKSKKAALELSIGTIVILVLAMSMLILGLILIRTIFTGAKYNVDTMNKKVEAEINKLFVEDQRAVLYLPNRLAEIKQGKEFGIAFGIQNNIATQKFKWGLKVIDDSPVAANTIKRKCGVSVTEVERWVTTGGSGNADIASGQKYLDIIRFNIQEGTVSDISTCIVRFQLVIKKEDGTVFTTEPFDVDVN